MTRIRRPVPSLLLVLVTLAGAGPAHAQLFGPRLDLNTAGCRARSRSPTLTATGTR